MIYRIFTVLSVLPDCITMGITGGVDTFLTIDKPEGFFEDSDSESYSLISGEKSTDTVMKKKRVNKKRKCDCHDELLAIERRKLELFEEIVHLKRESLCFKKLKHSTTNVFE
ncbi:uncharacterized protein LOC127845718 isoform X2 [Dreissena polymorpha]|uniref:uncharacterized protein LOC127834708 n=1 Tax=Dreissena polymorpha TaxID=45954 RepID=UPI0022654AA5|nr:uncharacterized protein LOC127834708 [Dreissena polymorpha]XP_052232778.1 uncharacterized protein LOC127845718 isoform X2 [Dreissena polymorpha]